MNKVLLTTTFALLKEHDACISGYRKLTKYLGNIGKDIPINLLTILDSNGVDDCLWCMKATQQDSIIIDRLIACAIAEAVLPVFEKVYPKDSRPRKAIEVARLYVKGKATDKELAAARSAAGSASSAAGSARSAAEYVAWSAAEYVARSAAEYVAWSTAEYVAGLAEREEQSKIIRKYLKEG